VANLPAISFADEKGEIVAVRRLIIGVGAMLLLAGVIGLLVPVSVSDGNGKSIGCGNAVATDLSAARNANDSSVANVPVLSQVVPHTDYVAKCQSEVGTRRAWTIPLTVVGILALGGALLVRRSEGAGSSV
jgi:hypothetical protein